MNLTNLQKKELNGIKRVLKVDLTPHIEERFTDESYITFWTNDLTINEINNIERYANQYKTITVEPNGYRKLAIMVKS